MNVITKANASVKALEALIQERRKQWEQDLAKARSLNKDISPEAPLVISFVGRFKSGKSSLINALIGTELLPTRATTATTVVTRIFYGSVGRAYVCTNGAERQISIEEAQEIILTRQVQDGESVEVVFELPLPLLKGNVELRDTPGMMDGAQEGRLEAVALETMYDTDLCVFVYDASTFISQREREVTNKIHRMLGGNIVYAVNCINRLNTEEDVEDVRALAQRFAGQREHTAGMGKLWMICSNPGMIRLDGFDAWLAALLDSDREALRGLLRKRASTAQLQEVTVRTEEEVNALISERIEPLLEKVKEFHARATAESLRKARNAFSEWERNLRSNVQAFKAKISNSSDLDALKPQFAALCSGTDWQKSYAGKCQDIVLNYFTSRCQELYATLNPMPNNFNERAIIQRQQMPGATFHEVKGTVSDAIKGAGIGGIIAGVAATILTGGAAAPVLLGGAAFGAWAGKSSTHINISAETSLNYVKQTILPALLQGLDKSAEKAIAQKKKGVHAGKTGLEHAIATLSPLSGELTKLITVNGAALNDALAKLAPLNSAAMDCEISPRERVNKSVRIPASKNPVRVALMGRPHAGRRTLAGALVSSTFRVADHNPIVLLPYSFEEGQRDEAELFYRRGGRERIADLEHMNAHLFKGGGSESAQDVDRVEIKLRDAKLGGMKLLIPVCPGSGAAPDAQPLQADLVVFVLEANFNPLPAETQKWIHDLSTGTFRNNIFFVVTHADMRSAEGLETIKSSLRAVLSSSGLFTDANGRFDEALYKRRVFFLDAYKALCARTGSDPLHRFGWGDSVAIEGTGFPEFEKCLKDAWREKLAR